MLDIAYINMYGFVCISVIKKMPPLQCKFDTYDPMKEFVCIILTKIIRHRYFEAVYQISLALDFAYGYICDCSICSRAHCIEIIPCVCRCLNL